MKLERKEIVQKPILLLLHNNPTAENIFMDAINKSMKVEARCVFKPSNILLGKARGFMLSRGIPGIGFWFGDWKKKISDYELIVMVATFYTPCILRWIHKKYPKVRLIHYYWDKVEISGYPVEKSDYFENWSFDKEDCKRYGFQYNPQYYSKYLELPKSKENFDISFVGADREGIWPERVKMVNETYKMLKEYNFHTFFYLVSKSRQAEKKITYKKRLSEKEFFRIIGSSQAVVDFVQPGKEWMTQRPLLALVNGRKLITNYTGIREYEFYDRNNIFILGMDALERLDEFMETPFSMRKNKEFEKYEVNKWAERFLKYEGKVW